MSSRYATWIAVALCVGLHCLSCAGLAATRAAAPVATLGKVRYEGFWTASGSALFRGIPFAQPPVGPLRWKAPQPLAVAPGTHPAIQPAPSCLQAFVGWNRGDAEHRAEDCLYLDIRTPRLNRRARLPVLVWIHGGANWAGSGGWVVSSGLADRGIVVVSVAYRLGVFGFLSHPELTHESAQAAGNFALMDQIAALDWVKRNIAAFGGDPAAVTIAGDSAGGQDVGLLMISPTARGLFARAIQQSGTAGFGLPSRSLADNEKLGVAFAGLAGVDQQDGQIEALRALDAGRLLEAQMMLESAALTDNSFIYLQSVTDGWIVPAPPAELLKAGKSARVPLLIGNSAQELTLYGGDSAVRRRVVGIFGPLADQALELYGLKDGLQPADDPILGSTAMQIAADDTFRCPAEFTAAAHAATGAKVWRYQMERAAPGQPRIDHGSELTFILDNRPLNIAVDGVRPLLQSYWVNFIAHGDPNGPGLPAWPEYGAKRAYVAFTQSGPESRTALRASVCALLPRP